MKRVYSADLKKVYGDERIDKYGVGYTRYLIQTLCKESLRRLKVTLKYYESEKQ